MKDTKCKDCGCILQPSERDDGQCVDCFKRTQHIAYVRVENWGDFEPKFMALVRRAVKLGLPAPDYHILGDITCEYPKEGKRTEVIVYRAVYYWGDAPVLPGWEFIAAIDHTPTEDGEYMNIVRTMEGKECPPRFRTTGPHCEHCHTTRRRNHTYVVLNVERNEVCQVGSSCIRDFLGGATPDSIARWAEFYSALDNLGGDSEFEQGGGGRSPFIRNDEYLPYVALAIRLNGWVSGGAAFKSGGYLVPTKITALDYMFPAPSNKDKTPEPGAVDLITAKRALSWAEEELLPRVTEQGDGANEYEWNLAAIACAGVFNIGKQAGFIASLIPAFQKALGQRLYEEAAAKRPPSEFIGKSGTRFGGAKKGSPEALLLRVLNVKTTESMYGVSYLYTFLQEGTGNIVKWFASSDQSLKQGGTYRIAGTVKKHEMLGRCPTCRACSFHYQPGDVVCGCDDGVQVSKSTMLSRCTILDTLVEGKDEYDDLADIRDAKRLALQTKNAAMVAFDVDFKTVRDAALQDMSRDLKEYHDVNVALHYCKDADEVYERVLQQAIKSKCECADGCEKCCGGPCKGPHTCEYCYVPVAEQVVEDEGTTRVDRGPEL